jgi:hypothetical protein
MRSFLFAALTILVFAVTMIGETTDAYAFVCARGVVRADTSNTLIGVEIAQIDARYIAPGGVITGYVDRLVKQRRGISPCFGASKPLEE